MDHSVGKLLKKLVELNLYENTLIIFISDHSDPLGDTGLHTKESRIIPLIIIRIRE